jgi:LacI family transcriptional regulator
MRQIAVLLGTDRQYHRGVLQGVARYARLHGPWELQAEPTYAGGQIPLAKLRHVDGIIMLVSSRRQIRLLQRWNMPAVNLSSRFPEAKIAHVSNDGTSLAKLAIEHFIERGFHNFAFCDLNDASFYRRRRFEEQLALRGLHCHVFDVGFRDRNAWILGRDRKRMEAWLRELPKPIGVLAHNDVRGRQLVDACRRLEIAMPDEVAVLGVDNEVPHCEMCSPPLSSIITDAERIGFEAAGLLDQIMEGKELAQHRVLVPPLGIVVRQSTDVTATTDPHVAKAVRFIRLHATDGIDVSDVLRHVMISRTALDKRFLEALGHTPHEEILRVRLKRASELLAETDLTLETVADRCGFNHGEYLGAVFLRETGQTPGDFRDQHRVSSSNGGPPQGRNSLQASYANGAHLDRHGIAKRGPQFLRSAQRRELRE